MSARASPRFVKARLLNAISVAKMMATGPGIHRELAMEDVRRGTANAVVAAVGIPRLGGNYSSVISTVKGAQSIAMTARRQMG
jgi:hypothetical protein